MSEDKLLPCPFCGGSAQIKLIPNPPHHFAKYVPKAWVVECVACGCNCGWIREAEEDAMKAWNTRAQPDNSDVKQEYRNQFDKCRKCDGYIGASEEMLEDSGHACDCAQPDNSELVKRLKDFKSRRLSWPFAGHEQGHESFELLDACLKALQGADNEVRNEPTR